MALLRDKKTVEKRICSILIWPNNSPELNHQSAISFYECDPEQFLSSLNYYKLLIIIVVEFIENYLSC